MSDGFIKLHRSLLRWEWYTDVKTLSVFIYCLLRANHKAEKWQGNTIERGQFIASVQRISTDTGLSVKSVRTALNHLKSTSELAIETANRFSLISVCNWALYQDRDDEWANKTASNETNKGQTNGKQRATNKNDKNDKNDKNVNKEKEIYKERHPHGEFLNVFLSDEELSKVSHEMIERLSAYKASTGKNYKSDYATILNWSRKDRDKPVKSNVSNFKGREYSASHFAEMEEDLSKYAKADN